MKKLADIFTAKSLPRGKDFRGMPWSSMRIFVALMAALLTPLASQAAVELEILSSTSGTDTLIASGATPNSPVAFVGVGRQSRQAVVSVYRGCDLITAGPDGVAVWPLTVATPDVSKWIALDITSGGVAFSQKPTANSRASAPFPLTQLVLNRQGEVEALRFEADGDFQIVIARPGTGTWCEQVADGGERDADYVEDGGATLAAPELDPAAGTTTLLSNFQVGDFVIVADSDGVTISSMQITAADVQNGFMGSIQ